MSTAIDIEKLKEEITLTTSRSGGPGGQNVNKVETKVTSMLEDLTQNSLL